MATEVAGTAAGSKAAAANGARQPGSGGGRSKLGREGEELAARVLVDAGLVVLDRNWRSQPGVLPREQAGGELDIVARDGDCLVMVEVKTRSGPAFGAPAEAVDARKQRRLRRLAAAWLAEARRNGSRLGFRSVRFDVVSVVRRADGSFAVDHLPGVF